MKAKDTVMSQDGIDAFWYSGEGCDTLGLAEAQAEISFKAGEKQATEDSHALQELARQDGERHGLDTGKREVVRWIENNANLTCTNYDWETQKEKWGIHETN